ncbi:MAG TPA: NFACT family protein, partial [Candidatus Eisenbacteria bacterium]|nr:NFACT family protein [Candidatus Eisenbacteria bacterium]
MTALRDQLAGRRIAGVIALSPRSFAISLEPKPRRYLWVHLDRKEAFLAIAPDLPIPPDPRGSPFGGLETALRGRAVIGVEQGERGAFVIRLGEEDGGVATHSLSLATAGRRINLEARSIADDTILWAHHRDEEPAGAAPAGFHPPHATLAENQDEREAVGDRIATAFREDFDRDMRKTLDGAERSLARRIRGLESDLERARERLKDRRRGEILLSHYGEIQRGASRVELPDPYADSPGAKIEIELNPALSPHENAAFLFRRAKRGERGETETQNRLTRARKSIEALSEMRRALLSQPPKEALGTLESFLREAGLPFSSTRGDQRGSRLGRRTTAAPRARHPGRRSQGAHQLIRPRTLFTSDGWEVWVGRST